MSDELEPVLNLNHITEKAAKTVSSKFMHNDEQGEEDDEEDDDDDS